ncbi:hypothetical protein RB195_006231 [Necator americanus]|uniref:Uncharacterized protein n=1 Tax=Necator americanus TaxID=51031 RepID=A0ABR1BUK7_NECAM
MSTVPGSNLKNSTGHKAKPVPPLPKNGTRGRMWSEVWKLWSWPQFLALLLQKTAASHEATTQEVTTISTPPSSTSHKTSSIQLHQAELMPLSTASATPLHKLRNSRAARRKRPV